MGSSSVLNQPLDDIFVEKAKALLKKFEGGDVTDAIQDLVHLNEERIQLLYGQIGKITRGLHRAITNLEIDQTDAIRKDVGELDKVENGTHSRLRYVSDLTLEAVHTTMDLLDRSIPIATELGSESNELRQEWLKLDPAEMAPAEFQRLYKRIDRYLEFAERQASHLNENFTEIMVTQGYQDLSGQMLNKVMASLAETEKDLLDLLEMASQMQHVSGIDPVESRHATKSSFVDAAHIDGNDVLNSQNEVDDLLSSLGF